MLTLRNLIHEANTSTIETYRGIAWVLTELVSKEAKRHALHAIVYLLIAVGCLSAIPFTLKFVYDAYSVGDTAGALWGLLYTLIASTAAVEFGTFHDKSRERMWNRNYFTIRTGLIWKLFTRSREEVLGEQSEFGVEQVESTKDKAQNILYLLGFESPVVIAMIVTSTAFLYIVDAGSALVLTGLTIFNLLWFYLFNTVIDKVMGPIDKKFRSENRRSNERVNMYTTVTAHGVEEKMLNETRSELRSPLNEDLEFWAKRFPKIDIWRRRINGLVPVTIVAYIIWQHTLTIGDITAVAAWSFAVSREYGYIGHLMRHLTSQVARIRACVYHTMTHQFSLISL